MVVHKMLWTLSLGVHPQVDHHQPNQYAAANGQSATKTAKGAKRRKWNADDPSTRQTDELELPQMQLQLHG
jgi:hypothetical protein